MANEKVPSDVIDEMLREVAPNATDVEKVKITALLFELLRLCAANPQATLRAITFLSKLPWGLVSFPVLEAAAKDELQLGRPVDGKMSARCLNVAREFCNIMQIAPDAVSRETLTMLSVETPTAPEHTVKYTPSIASVTALAQVFEPAKVTAQSGISLLTWQSRLPSGPGPAYAAVDVSAGLVPLTSLLLETGEIITSFTGSISPADEQDYTFAPSTLLANYCARILSARHISDETPYPDKLGSFNRVVIKAIAAQDISELCSVFKTPQQGFSRGVTVRFDDTLYRATLTAHFTAAGPYAVATLIDAQDRVLVRLDTPRMFSPTGVYIFPLGNTAYALVVD